MTSTAMTPSDDTIYALASAPGRAGVAVWRLSGPTAGAALVALIGRLPAPRRATLAVVRAPGGESPGGDIIDEGLALWFPAPASFTGEDVAELHLHGGRAVAAALAEALAALGLRPAEPGEFSRRAFLNGRMDLTRAEAIADLVDAETAAQRRQALRQMGGALDRLAEGWRNRLMRGLALVEAVIDFADEGVPDSLLAEVAGIVAGLAAELEAHLADGHRGERLRDGLHIAILGAPNAGKSSLLNRLAGRDAAIVSAEPGTTRDVIEVHLDLGGWPVIVADTAGLRPTAEAIEAEGVRRAHGRAQAADLKLAVFDAGLLPELDRHTLEIIDADTLVVLNKGDLATEARATGPLPAEIAGRPRLVISAATGAGLDQLVATLAAAARARFEVTSGPPVLTRARHRAAVGACLAALRRFDPAGAVELAAEDLRLAARAIGRITGRVEVDELLDVVFREFCIGK